MDPSGALQEGSGDCFGSEDCGVAIPLGWPDNLAGTEPTVPPTTEVTGPPRIALESQTTLDQYGTEPTTVSSTRGGARSVQVGNERQAQVLFDDYVDKGVNPETIEVEKSATSEVTGRTVRFDIVAENTATEVKAGYVSGKRCQDTNSEPVLREPREWIAISLCRLRPHFLAGQASAASIQHSFRGARSVVQTPKESPLVSASFLVVDPNYYRAGALRKVLHIISSHESYVPESVAGGQDKVETAQFSFDFIERLAEKWETTNPPLGWDLERRRPRVEVDIMKVFAIFEPLIINVERGFLDTADRLTEFVALLKELYSVIHPAYGDVHIEEMMGRDNMVEGKRNLIGIDLKRALPNLYWAIFLGPEYVDMFGSERVFSAPVQSAEHLSDGGALLILSKSPLDYLSQREEFEKRQIEAKRHLGLEAFDTGDISYRGRVPNFRFLAEKERERQALFRRGPDSSGSKADWLSTVRREEWNDWVAMNRSLALEFAQELGTEGLKLDFSPNTLQRVDNYVETLRASKTTPQIGFLKRLSAYVAQIVVRNTGAAFSFDESEDFPSLRVGKIQVSPLARAQKAILEGEKFEPWYKYLLEELTSTPNSRASSVVR